MFDRTKVTDKNARMISERIYEDPEMLRMLNIDLDRDGDERDTNIYNSQKREFYRVVLYFAGIVELLDRTSVVSYEAFSEYEKVLSHETLFGNYDRHVNRCREAETGDDDFIVDAANRMEHTHADEWFVMTRIATISTFEKAFEKMMTCCTVVFT